MLAKKAEGRSPAGAGAHSVNRVLPTSISRPVFPEGSGASNFQKHFLCVPV